MKKEWSGGLKIFLLLVVLTTTLIITLTSTEETIPALKNIIWVYLFYSFLLVGVYMILESIRIEILSKLLSGKFIRFTSALKFILCGAFLSAITPFQAGGAPIQMFILRSDGMDWDKILSLLLLRGIFYILSVILLSLFFLSEFVKTSPYSIGMLSYYAVSIYLIIFTLLFLILFKPVPLKRFVLRLSMPKGRRTHLTKMLFSTFSAVGGMRKAFISLFKEKTLWAIFLIFFTALVYLPNHSVAYLLLLGLRQKVGYSSIILKQIFLLMSGFFFPTPGAEGMMEGGFLFLFKGSIDQEIIGIFTVLWRFLTYHIIVIIGGFTTLSLLKKIDFQLKNNIMHS